MTNTTALLTALLVSLVALQTLSCAVQSPALKEANRQVDKIEALQKADVTLEDETGPQEKADKAEVGAEPCFDRAFSGSPDAMPDPAQVISPCWKALLSAQIDYDKDAEDALRKTREQRATNKALAEAEASACAGLGEQDAALSPFYHGNDIVSVEEMKSGNTTQGARITFKQIKGLDEAWMLKAVRCHMTRSQVLCDPDSALYCPLALMDIDAEVKVIDGKVVVELRSVKVQAAEAILQRARERLQPGL